MDAHALDKLNSSDRSNPHRLGSLLKKLKDPAYVSPLSPTVTLGDHASIKISVLLHDDPDHMRARISDRVADRLENGAIEECQQLLSKGYSSDMPGLQTLGYAQIFAHLRGEYTIEEAKGIWIDKEYQYSRRQKLYLSKYISEATFERV
jgi:tRNA dimethylallyltransferase